MVRTDILGALESAITRGYSVEQAIQSLVNSGYSRQEINEAASMLKIIEQPQEIQQTSQQPNKKIQGNPNRTRFLIILLVVILIVLFGVLLAAFLFKEQIGEIFSSLFG